MSRCGIPYWKGRRQTMLDLEIIRKLAPEVIDVLVSRARILQRIYFLQPIGRRALAIELSTTERILRAEVELLRHQGLLVAAPAGMSLSEEGYSLLEQLDKVLAELEGRTELCRNLSRLLNVPKVVVISGDCDGDGWVKRTLGQHAGIELRKTLVDGDVVAVTGGTTLEAMAERIPRASTQQNVRVVPARGGLGENLSVQANTIASKVASQLGGTSVMLHVPDRLSEETLQKLLEEPHVLQRLAEIREANIVVHGIGSAMRMAERRQLLTNETELLSEQNAVAEAFGYYFNPQGHIVHSMATIGIRLDDLSRARSVIAVAGGRSKAAAICAAAKGYRIDVLVTDEGAAKEMLQMNTTK